ncbi:hypothetical protein P280DRAFT_519590 [Massarina eburnea CBS 473.64]|uniref:Uncharacterized protein n=1 Tax=Massarina eburnea CBS 473.64 TaxID=1395130 RepID=A0A6A6RW78_9PLEO|nr:hypothetical protein P280DRAFT_519590 [Massarina eburnea CBS 473.64]
MNERGVTKQPPVGGNRSTSKTDNLSKNSQKTARETLLNSFLTSQSFNTITSPSINKGSKANSIQSRSPTSLDNPLQPRNRKRQLSISESPPAPKRQAGSKSEFEIPNTMNLKPFFSDVIKPLVDGLRNHVDTQFKTMRASIEQLKASQKTDLEKKASKEDLHKEIKLIQGPLAPDKTIASLGADLAGKADKKSVRLLNNKCTDNQKQCTALEAKVNDINALRAIVSNTQSEQGSLQRKFDSLPDSEAFSILSRTWQDFQIRCQENLNAFSSKTDSAISTMQLKKHVYEAKMASVASVMDEKVAGVFQAFERKISSLKESVNTEIPDIHRRLGDLQGRIEATQLTSVSNSSLAKLTKDVTAQADEMTELQKKVLARDANDKIRDAEIEELRKKDEARDIALKELQDKEQIRDAQMETLLKKDQERDTMLQTLQMKDQDRDEKLKALMEQCASLSASIHNDSQTTQAAMIPEETLQDHHTREKPSSLTNTKDDHNRFEHHITSTITEMKKHNDRSTDEIRAELDLFKARITNHDTDLANQRRNLEPLLSQTGKMKEQLRTSVHGMKQKDAMFRQEYHALYQGLVHHKRCHDDLRNQFKAYREHVMIHFQQVKTIQMKLERGITELKQKVEIVMRPQQDVSTSTFSLPQALDIGVGKIANDTLYMASPKNVSNNHALQNLSILNSYRLQSDTVSHPIASWQLVSPHLVFYP